LHIKAGSGIAQVIFHCIAKPAAYSGKYQSARKGPQLAIDEPQA
jgi:deoxycytidine triphosphate deaminase